jgi:hypothetical protein
MQISKSFLVVCAMAYCAALLPLCAADTEAQIKAREALQKKMDELRTQPEQAMPQPVVTTPAPQKKTPPPTTTMPAWRTVPPAQFTPQPVPAPRSTSPAAQPVPVAQPAASAVAPAAQPTGTPVLITPQPVDSASITRAREALRQKMAELQAQGGQAVPQPVVTAPPPAQTVITAPVITSPPVTQPVAPPAIVQPVVPAVQPAAQASVAAPRPSDPESIAKARQAVDAQMKELTAQEAAQASLVGLSPGAGQKAHDESVALRVLRSFPPLQAPPSSVSAAKQQRLNDLLYKYKADQITPEQYHQQRAKILAEP